MKFFRRRYFSAFAWGFVWAGALHALLNNNVGWLLLLFALGLLNAYFVIKAL